MQFEKRCFVFGVETTEVLELRPQSSQSDVVYRSVVRVDVQVGFELGRKVDRSNCKEPSVFFVVYRLLHFVKEFFFVRRQIFQTYQRQYATSSKISSRIFALKPDRDPLACFQVLPDAVTVCDYKQKEISQFFLVIWVILVV
jgi:hypothetical protein